MFYIYPMTKKILIYYRADWIFLHYIFSNVTLFSKFVYLCIGKNVLNENADSSLKKDVWGNALKQQ